MKTPVWESLFNKVADLPALKFAKFLRRPILENICERLFFFRFLVQKTRLIHSHTSPFSDFHYTIPSENTRLMA